jgi:hypothetical protein
MKFKLDENFGTRTQRIIRAAGHDVQTVRDEGLQGSSDQHLYDVCRVEQRCLVTLDLDFADTIRFQPVQGAGIAVITPSQESKPTFIGTVGTAVSGDADENVHIRKAVGDRNWPYPGASDTRGRRLKCSAPTAHFQLYSLQHTLGTLIYNQ